jgi:hypothetical protein
MGHRLQTQEGKKRYALRKQIPEPVLGVIKVRAWLPSVSAARASITGTASGTP